MFTTIQAVVETLVGFAALVTVLVNVLKVIKVKGEPIVKDGQAPLWTAGLNMVGTLVFYGIKLFVPSFDFGPIDSVFAEMATVGTFIMSFVGQVLVSKITHSALRGTPVIGTSYSYTKSLNAS